LPGLSKHTMKDAQEVRKLACKLGIQPTHVHANQLLDLAEARDREGYRAKLDELDREYGDGYGDSVNAHAKRQLRMQNANRYNGWRSVWQEWKKSTAVALCDPEAGTGP